MARITKKLVREELAKNDKVLNDSVTETPDDLGFIRYLTGYSVALRELLEATK